MWRSAFSVAGLILVDLLLPGGPLLAQQQPQIKFATQIQPLLSSKCFACHGPNAAQQQTALRLHNAAAATADLGGYQAIAPAAPAASELLRRITSTDAAEIMPPPEHGEPLTVEEQQLLRLWITQGAEYEDHWAFRLPAASPPPEDLASAGNPIDYFVGQRLKQESLNFSSPAAAATLVRRLHLDLTGLPASPEVVARFSANPTVAAWEGLVDQLLASPQCAERLTLDWLDVARYADTNGYSIDDHRDMWIWRDWVLNAFSTNLPWNHFIQQQIAGDLLPNATPETTMATGFLRNGMNTHEGGTIAEEYRVAAIADKIDTVSTAFLGLTMRCAQCHDHKYDPITQKDYYRFFAFFNASSETGRGAVNGNSAPFIQTDSPLLDTEQFHAFLDERIAALNAFRNYPGGELQQARSQWEQDLLKRVATPATADRVAAAFGQQTVFPLPADRDRKAFRKLSWIWTNQQGKGEAAWFRHQFELSEMPAKAALILSCDNEADVFLNGASAGTNPDWRTPTTLNVLPMLRAGSNLLAVTGRDWEGGSKAALLAVLAITDNDGAVRYICSTAEWQAADSEISGWNLPGDVDGFAPAAGVTAYGQAPYGRILHTAVSSQNQTPEDVLAALLQIPRGQRTSRQDAALTDAYAAAHPPMQTFSKSIDTEIKVLQKQQQAGQPTVMVMDHAAPDRPTPILVRGQYNVHGDAVTAGIPELFGTLPDDQPVTRLDLAEWLTDSANPLTARVTVNRFWQLLFGRGLVKTTEDFGVQGDYPSHPELLDWLAADFVQSGWDLRRLLKMMLTSRTWQQSSDVTPELLERDPDNRLLARASRYRLQAEILRDHALALGGLLDPQIGGPSVYPSQPSGLWKQVSHYGYLPAFTAQHYFPDQTKQLRRRSMYTFWKRTSPPPSMMVFDAPNRETCVVRRDRTNTPLQALVLLNSAEYAAAAAGLAEQMDQHGGEPQQRLQFGFRRVTGRNPADREMQLLQQAWQEQFNQFEQQPDNARAWLDYSGVQAADQPAERAAMVAIASLLLNLDECLTRE